MMDYRRITAGLLALTAMTTAAFSCSSKKTSRTVSEVTTADNTVTAEATTGDGTFSSGDMTINWLSYYDLNPEGNAERSVALALYEDKCGGAVNYIQTSRKMLLPKLEAMIAAGEEVDMFPYELSTFPQNVSKGLSAPLDPYFEQLSMDNKELWSDLQGVIDGYAYNGEHYIVPYEAVSPVLLTYSRKLVKDEDLSDPYELYKEGKWDWDAFTGMMDSFVENAPGGAKRYGICGSYEQALIQSAGNTAVSYDGKGAKDTANAEKLINDITEKGLSRTDYWLDCFPTDLNTLFFAAEDWTLGKSNARNEEADLMTVPFPKAPDAQNYTTICDFHANMLAANSEKGGAVATYILCERYAATEKKYKEAAKQIATAVETAASGTKISFVTEEQYDAIQGYLSDKNNALMPDIAYKTAY